MKRPGSTLSRHRGKNGPGAQRNGAPVADTGALLDELRALQAPNTAAEVASVLDEMLRGGVQTPSPAPAHSPRGAEPTHVEPTDSEPQTIAGQAPAPSERGWRSHRLAGALIGVAVLVIPIAASVVTATFVSRLAAQPSATPSRIGWWAGVLGASTLALVVVERMARQLVPLAGLLKMTLVFPDRAPSRLAVARLGANTRRLQRWISDEHDRSHEPADVATHILALATALSLHDRQTRGHSERVRALTDMLANELGLPVEERSHLRWAALLHDIGKLRVDPAILNKRGAPNAQEWVMLRRHPIDGARLAAPLMTWLGEWGPAIEQHHERWDGTGYPRGLAGDEICYGARIVSVADVFDTLTATRSYRQAIGMGEARAELARCAGTQLDPAIVRAFLNISIGRLRVAMVPMSWLIELPVVANLSRLGAVVSASGVAAGAAVIGATAIGTGPAPVVNGTFAHPPSVHGVPAPGTIGGRSAGPNRRGVVVTPNGSGQPAPPTSGVPPSPSPVPTVPSPSSSSPVSSLLGSGLTLPPVAPRPPPVPPG